MKRTRKRPHVTPAERAAAALHLSDCPHDGHWLVNAEGRVMGRCGCWIRAMQAVAELKEAQAS